LLYRNGVLLAEFCSMEPKRDPESEAKGPIKVGDDDVVWHIHGVILC
jgi:hypothetical protein